MRSRARPVVDLLSFKTTSIQNKITKKLYLPAIVASIVDCDRNKFWLIRQLELFNLNLYIFTFLLQAELVEPKQKQILICINEQEFSEKSSLWWYERKKYLLDIPDIISTENFFVTDENFLYFLFRIVNDIEEAIWVLILLIDFGHECVILRDVPIDKYV